MATKTLYVRGSSLPTHHDCGLRWAVENVPELKLPPKDPDAKRVYGIGQVIGDHGHMGAAEMLLEKMSGDGVDVERAIERACLAYRKDTKVKKIQVDAVTRNTPDGEVQLERMLRAWAEVYLPIAQPQKIETHFKARYSENLILTATPDIVSYFGRGVWGIGDHKFGGNLGAYEAQLGDYGITVGAQEFFKEGHYFEEFSLIWTRRRGINSKQPTECKIIPFNTQACEKLARTELDAIDKEYQTFLEEGDPFVFGPNPGSKFCNAKGCIAFNTDRCPLGRNKGDESDSTDDD